MLGRFATAAALLALGLAVGAAAGLATDWYLRTEALADAFTRLRLFHELRRASLEDNLKSMASDVRAASENPRVVDATEKLIFAWTTFSTDARKTLQRLYVEENAHVPSESTSSATPATAPTTAPTIGSSMIGPSAFASISAITMSF